MALKIRFRQQGRANRQTFRLVVTDVRRPRDGKYLETLGSYNPFEAENNLKLNLERLQYWLSQGAQIADNAEKLIAKTAPDVIKGLKAQQHAKRIKMTAKRRAARVKKKSGVSKQARKESVDVSIEPSVQKATPSKKRAKKKDES